MLDLIDVPLHLIYESADFEVTVYTVYCSPIPGPNFVSFSFQDITV